MSIVRAQGIFRRLMEHTDRGRKGMPEQAIMEASYLMAHIIGGPNGLPKNPPELQGEYVSPCTPRTLTEVVPPPKMQGGANQFGRLTEEVPSYNFTSSDFAPRRFGQPQQRVLTEGGRVAPPVQHHRPRTRADLEAEMLAQARALIPGVQMVPPKDPCSTLRNSGGRFGEVVSAGRAPTTEAEWIESMSERDREEMLRLAGITPKRTLTE